MRWVDNARARQARARERYADRLDRRVTRKAVRRSPESPVMIGRVLTAREVETLIGRGWTLIDQNPILWQGTSLHHEYFLMKRRPGAEPSP